MTMEQQTQWHFEVNNPLKSTEWRTLWGIDEDQLGPSRALRNELNRINARSNFVLFETQIKLSA